ncbi:protein SSUH2 homolog [Eucyclogobius newberryi]|uniref:protein SSUH2 homolog n=1 Tax=Eucyclogobius newberryi TaxID=166745 RepID=UPI003B58F476
MNSSAIYPPGSAPPADMFGNVPGYEGIEGGGFLPPPVPLEPIAPPQPGPSPDEWSIPSISEDEAHEAFKTFASGHCCWSSAPAKDGVITSTQSFNTYRYRLETYTESRSTEWSQKPHEGEAADFYTQPAPRPWEVQATPPNHFTNHTENIRVPFTASVKECHNCRAQGTMPCETCHGDGKKPCWVCNGAGTKDEQNCSRCNGTGTDRCDPCSGRGTQDCDVCKGKRQMLSFINLKVEWEDHVEDHVVHQESGLNPEKLKSVHGKELFKNCNSLLFPLVGFPNPLISEASDRMIRDHQTKFSQSSRILQQRQTVELIPISKVSYKWKSNSHSFYVYGNEREVSADDYPATCCCVVM